LIDVGSKIGSYEIIALLKSGGMATLFLGRRTGAAGFSRHVAIKVVHPHLGRDSTFVRMFQDEAKLSEQIRHPNVVHVEELGKVDDTYFLVMEYVHGCSLSDLLRGLGRMGRRLSPDLAVWLAMEILEGLHAAHELKDEAGQLLEVVHRDVSPQNVLIAENGSVKVIDFGIAKALGRSQQTRTGALKGKLSYMAPEQAYGTTLDRRTDIYALGIVLWELLTMRRVFKADNDFALLDHVRNPKIPSPREFSDDVSQELEAVVMSALARDVDRRPKNARALRRRLAEACPRATSLDTGHMADVIEAVLGQEMDARKQELPESLTGMSRDIPLAHEPTRRARAPRMRDDVMREMTASAPGSTLYSDSDAEDDGPDTGPIEASPLEETRLSRPSSRPPAAVVTPTAVTREAGSSRDRMIALGAVGIALVAMAAAGFVLIRGSGDAATTSGVVAPEASTSPAGADLGTSAPPLDASPLEVETMVFADEGLDDTSAPEDEDPQPTRGMRRTMRGMTKVTEDDEAMEMGMSLVDGVPIFDDDEF
jgi:serine/threonine-protein kinase